MAVQLITTLPLQKIPVHITYQSPVFLMGSCFSDVLAQRLRQKKFQVLSNPFGTVYNPSSICRMMIDILDNHVPEKEDIRNHNGIFFHTGYHSDMSSLSREETFERIESTTDTAHSFIQSANCVFITFGSAFVYIEKTSRQIVANNHKLPASNFDKRLLSIEDIVEDSKNMINRLRHLQPEIPIIFTVSPVRHIRDGLEENNRSKARLLEAVHLLRDHLPGIFYFPSYELVLDQLRDYRFYEKDLIHPNELAHDVIWEYFSNTFFSEKTTHILTKTEKITAAFHHRPRHDRHPDYITFCRKQLEEINQLSKEISLSFFQEELDYFQSMTEIQKK